MVSSLHVDVRLTTAGPGDRARLAAMFELYVYDFSELLGLDVGDDGRFRVPPLDAYWTHPRRHAFLVRVDEKLAGFALVHEGSRLSVDDVFDVAEFFVMRRYRRRGVGEQAARWLFDRFRGRWEVRQKKENVVATAFWRRVLGRYTGGRFDEVLLDDDRWRGPVQRFDSREVAAQPRIELRDVDESDVPLFFEYQRDETSARMAAFGTTAADASAYVTRWRKVLADPSTTHKAIVLDEQVVGFVATFRLEGKPNVTYWIAREHWGRGLATQALSRLLELVTERPPYASAARDNVASLRVLEKCGFHVCGSEKAFATARGEDVEEVLLELR